MSGKVQFFSRVGKTRIIPIGLKMLLIFIFKDAPHLYMSDSAFELHNELYFASVESEADYQSE